MLMEFKSIQSYSFEYTDTMQVLTSKVPHGLSDNKTYTESNYQYIGKASNDHPHDI